MRIGLLIFFIIFTTQQVLPQERVSSKQTVSREIAPGKTDLFSIVLADGDYLNLSIGYKGRINFFVLNPDGMIARQLNGASGEVKVPFAFAAEGAKVHYQQFVGGHDGLSWRGTFADGLIALLGVPKIP